MRSLLYIISILLITGCAYSGSRPIALDDAQRLMQTDPSAALTELNGVDVSQIQDSATMARWALLYSEALAANQLSAPSDTIVNIAIDYYSRHNQSDQLEKASHLKELILRSYRNDALATALYLQKEKEFLLYKERAKRQLYMSVGLFILFIAAAIIVWMRQRMKIQALQNEALIAEAAGFRSRIDASRGDVCRLETKLHGMLEKRFALIDSLCQTYYETQGTKAERKAIIDKVKDEIESVRTDSFHDMEQAVNDCRDNLLEKVRKCCPNIKPEDYMLLVYIASGLSTRSMSLLLGESVDVIYKRKSRLKSRLLHSDPALSTDISAIF